MVIKSKGIGFVGRVRKRVYETLDLTGILPNGVTAGPLVFAGSSSSPIVASTADTKFMQEFCSITATSGDNRLRYSRLYLDGAGSGGETLRVFTTVRAACSTAHGAHISLNFAGDTTGELSGLGVAGRFTLHVPDDADWTSGTLAAVQAELWADGAASDPDGVTELSFVRLVIGGNTTGDDDIETDAAFLSINTAAGAGSGSFVNDDITALSGKAGLRVNLNGSLYGYIPIVTGS